MIQAFDDPKLWHLYCLLELVILCRRLFSWLFSKLVNCSFTVSSAIIFLISKKMTVFLSLYNPVPHFIALTIWHYISMCVNICTCPSHIYREDIKISIYLCIYASISMYLSSISHLFINLSSIHITHTHTHIWQKSWNGECFKTRFLHSHF